jgi:hypothetical protein
MVLVIQPVKKISFMLLISFLSGRSSTNLYNLQFRKKPAVSKIVMCLLIILPFNLLRNSNNNPASTARFNKKLLKKK